MARSVPKGIFVIKIARAETVFDERQQMAAAITLLTDNIHI
jgi:hypothetical protein